MVLYCAKTIFNIKKKVFYFIGDKLTWKNLINKKQKEFKTVYVYDPFSLRYEYPKNVKFISSMQTAKRFLNVRLEKSATFIRGNEKEINRFLDSTWIGSDELTIYVQMDAILRGLATGILDKHSKRSINCISKYK